MTTTKYTLFDIPTKDEPPKSWSPNVWRARGVLNYKKVDYETEWVEYPDIRVRLAEFGIPSKGGLMPYTLPMLRVTITTDDGSSEPQIKYLTDSADIAKYICDNHPEPPLDYDHPVGDEIGELFKGSLMNPFMGLVLCDVPEVCLRPRSAQYFHETRQVWMKMPIAEYKKKKIEEGAWDELEVGMKKLNEMLKKNGGPFLTGEAVTFGDIKVVGHIIWAREGGLPETYEKIMQLGGPELDRFMKAAADKNITTRVMIGPGTAITDRAMRRGNDTL